ncbi:hypothetical protein [Aquitalea sp. USM4]|nr:hypothetical protein [Aquitalea sp. USM4]
MPHTLPDQKVQPSDTAYAGRFQRHKAWYVFFSWLEPKMAKKEKPDD